jgi:hypothetical protein
VFLGLALIGAYPEEWQEKVKDEERARRAIFGVYEARINARFSPEQGRYDFLAAKRDLDKLDGLYPDSAQVLRIRDTLEDLRNETLAGLNGRYKDLLAAGRLVPADGEDDIADVLAVVQAIEPGHRLLGDPQLPFRFAEETERAIDGAEYQRADALLSASRAYPHARGDARLVQLRWRLDRILARLENEQRISELERRLTEAQPRLGSLADYRAVRDELVTLADLSPASSVRQQVQARFESVFRERLAQSLAEGEWSRAEQLLFDFAPMLPAADVTRLRLALSRAEEQAGFSPDLAAREPLVRERVAAVRALLDAPAFTLHRRLGDPAEGPLQGADRVAAPRQPGTRAGAQRHRATAPGRRPRGEGERELQPGPGVRQQGARAVPGAHELRRRERGHRRCGDRVRGRSRRERAPRPDREPEVGVRRAGRRG